MEERDRVRETEAMKLKLLRYRYTGTHTAGVLYVEDEPFCNTLEPALGLVRWGAIPEGTYPVTLAELSSKFREDKAYAFCAYKPPRLLDVPGRSGILIHAGNIEAHTRGCILVGRYVHLGAERGRLLRSMAHLELLYQTIKPHGGELTIDVVNKAARERVPVVYSASD